MRTVDVIFGRICPNYGAQATGDATWCLPHGARNHTRNLEDIPAVSLHLTIALSDDPTLSRIGWAAARRSDSLFIVVSSLIPRWQQEVAPLVAASDDEYLAYELGLPAEEQARRVVVYGRYPALSRRRALIANRRNIGMAGRYGDHLNSLHPAEQQRRNGIITGGYSARLPLAR